MKYPEVQNTKTIVGHGSHAFRERMKFLCKNECERLCCLNDERANELNSSYPQRMSPEKPLYGIYLSVSLFSTL